MRAWNEVVDATVCRVIGGGLVALDALLDCKFEVGCKDMLSAFAMEDCCLVAGKLRTGKSGA